MKIALPNDVEYILNRLNKGDMSAYIVGGCVRDAVLGKTPHDWDICTSALPTEIIEAFKDKKVIKTGLQHGTVTLIKNGTPYEITTFRTDGEYLDNRRPENVRFIKSIEQDLARRDFTINAMAYNSKGLVDLYGGRQDIEKRIITTVGNSDKRFNEDALRILRALRFSAKLSFKIEKATAESIHSHKHLLKNIASERIWAEFTQLLMGGCVDVLREFADVIAVFIPQISPTIGFNQHSPYHCYDVWEHTLHALEHAPADITIRLAVLFHDIGKPQTFTMDESGTGHFYGHPKQSRILTEEILKSLKADNYTKNTVLTLVENHDRIINPTEKSVNKAIQRLGSAELFEKLIEVQKCDVQGQAQHLAEPRIKKLNTLLNIEKRLLEEKKMVISVKQLDISGSDIINLGVPQGKQVGCILNSLLTAVTNGTVQNSREELLTLASRLI